MTVSTLPRPPRRSHDHRITLQHLAPALRRLGRVEMVHNDAEGRLTLYVVDGPDKHQMREIKVSWSPVGYHIEDVDLTVRINQAWLRDPQDCASRIQGPDLAAAVLALRSSAVAVA